MPVPPPSGRSASVHRTFLASMLLRPAGGEPASLSPSSPPDAIPAPLVCPPMARIELRDFRDEDAGAVQRWFNDQRVTADLVGRRESFTEDDARGWVERAQDTSRDRKWAILLEDRKSVV